MISFNKMGPSVSIPFPVWVLKDSSIIWFNERWALENKIDIDDNKSVKNMLDYLLDNFGVCSRKSHGALSDEIPPRFMFADRYGGPFGKIHGGSGRCGSVGYINGKGIGPTPLVSKCADQSHSHGFLNLEEAVRDIIASEIAFAELPNGAVPVIALIDTGLTYNFGEDRKKEKCVVLVRPNVMRVSHFERSTFFGSSGFPGSDQATDAKRVSEVIEWSKNHKPELLNENFIAKITKNASIQAGACRASRFWPGRFTSDNVTVDGKLVEFGCFRTLPNWKRAHDGNGLIFGKEESEIANYFSSIPVHLAQQNVSHKMTSSKTNLAYIGKAVADSFYDEVAFGCGFDGLEKAKSILLTNMIKYYKYQQRYSYSLNWPQENWGSEDWIHPLEDFKDKNLFKSLIPDIKSGVHQACEQASHETGMPKSFYLERVDIWCKYRPNLYYSNIKNISYEIEMLSKKYDSSSIYRLTDAVFSREVSKSRRVFRELPKGLLPIKFVSDTKSSVIVGIDCLSRDLIAVVSGYICNDKFFVLDSRMTLRSSRSEFKNGFFSVTCRVSEKGGIYKAVIDHPYLEKLTEIYC